MALLTPFNKEEIITGIGPELRSHLGNLCLFDRLTSTNTYLLAQNTSQNGTVCLAEVQTAGRGRLNRSWYSPKGAGLYLSILWQLPPQSLSLPLTLMVGAAIVQALHHYGNHDVFSAIQLKWPNDILWQQQKLGGILIESASASPGRLVIGIGLNYALPKEATRYISQPHTDITTIIKNYAKQLTDRTAPPVFNRNTLASAVLTALLKLLTDLTDATLDNRQLLHTRYLAIWRAHDALKGKKVCLNRAKKGDVEGIADGITPRGELIVKQSDGSRTFISAGEIVSSHKSR